MSERPAELAAHQAAQEAAARVEAECAMSPNLHHQTMMTAHEGSPAVEVQDRTHGAGIPEHDGGRDPLGVVG